MRIGIRNYYDACSLDDNRSDLSTVYIPGYTNGTYRDANNAKNTVRGLELHPFDQTLYYTLQGYAGGDMYINFIGLQHAKLPTNCRIRLYMWNQTDWDNLGVTVNDIWVGGTPGVDGTFTRLFDITVDSFVVHMDKKAADIGIRQANWFGQNDTLVLYFDEPTGSYVDKNGVSQSGQSICKYFKLVIEDTANSTTSFATSRIWLGNYIAPTYSMSPGFTITYKNETDISYLPGGSAYVMPDYSSNRKLLKVDLSVVTLTDAKLIIRMLSNTGKREDIVIDLFPESDDIEHRLNHTFMGRLSKDPTLVRLPGGDDFYKISFTLQH